MANLRPINLCSVLYKAISKILVKRLQPFLPSLVCYSQSAFVSDRLISDNILIAHELVHGLRKHSQISTEFMALKSDMSKAYDRVEWGYIKALLTAMGFKPMWIGWVMSCLSSVSFSVLINDQPHGLIIPQRGLRQGDPLSPFLFVLCTEGLSHLIYMAEREGLLTGISFGVEGPSISHLLFADDSLFLCKASKEECLTLKNILNRYGEATGQEINVSKSSITFGDKVNIEKKKQMQEIFQIFSEGGAGTYLGLPECFSGSKVELFNYIKDKLKKRMDGWFGRLLSQGGKEILLKAVALAMPIYAMSCFRLPKTICDNLVSAMTQYWWSSRENVRKIPWVSWDKLCLPKELGGVGFKDLQVFNQSLLAKQAWRILTEPNSLLSRLFKSRYFVDGCLLQAKIGPNPSFAWKSIIFGRELMVKGIELQIGNGESTQLWMDPWIKDDDGICRAPLRKNFAINLSLKVGDLMDSEIKEWKRVMLEDLFYPIDVVNIMQIKPAWNHNDSWLWKYNKSGDFTVKSAYWLGIQSGSNVIRQEAEALPSINLLKDQVWKLLTEPKVRIFLWKALSNTLSVEEGLTRRGMKVDGRCQICGQSGETINHALFSCPFARQVWALTDIPMPKGCFDMESVYENINHLLRLGKKNLGLESNRRSWPWIIWNIWKRRNIFLFEGKRLDAMGTMLQGKEEAEMWYFAKTCDTDQERVEKLEIGKVKGCWSPPGKNWQKCNIGVFWCKTQMLVGASWVLRNERGEVRLHSRRCFTFIRSLDDAKLTVFRWTLECLHFHKIARVLIALCDKSLVGVILNPSRWPAFRPQRDELCELLQLIPDWKLIAEEKKANVGADLIASSVASYHLRQSYVASGAPYLLDDLFAAEATKARSLQVLV